MIYKGFFLDGGNGLPYFHAVSNPNYIFSSIDPKRKCYVHTDLFYAMKVNGESTKGRQATKIPKNLSDQ